MIAGWQIYEGTTPNWFLESLYRGLRAAGGRLGCDLLLSCGVGASIDDQSSVRPAWPAVLGGEEFVPVGPWNTDGLVVISPLRTCARREYVRRLQTEGHPVVFVGGGDGLPAVVADSVRGIREALLHLRDHGHRELVFVAGDPLDPGDSRVRLEAFHGVCEELGLSHEEARVEPGFHSEPGGYAAMKRLFERGCRFTAAMGSNDTSALGLMRALAESGRRVPDDVAVVGFDDQPWAAGHVPPLATVRYGLAEAGEKAVELVLRTIRGSAPFAGEVSVPTRLVARRSCGCLPGEATRPARVTAARKGKAGPAPAGVARAMADAIESAGSSLEVGEADRLCNGLVAGFEASLASGSPTAFERSLLALLERLEDVGDPAHPWQTALSSLRSGYLEPSAVQGSVGSAEDLLHLGRVVLSESAERRGGRQRLVDSEYEERVSEISVRLLSAQEESEVLDVLTECAPALGMEPTYLALYAGGPDSAPGSSRILLPEGDGKEPLEPGAELETRTLTFDRFLSEAAPRSLAVLPLVYRERATGIVAFATEDLAPCAAVARQLAVALESVRLQATTRALTLRDDLTGLYNRRFFESELQREVERSRRFGHDVALVMMDLDRFKAYNDSFGHRAGDEALRRVAACLVASAHRRGDAIIRYGGEEFAVLLPQTHLEGARQVAERFRRAVADCGDLRRPLTVSAGVAALRGEACEGERLVLEADQALYQAKSDGRNRVRLAPPSEV